MQSLVVTTKHQYPEEENVAEIVHLLYEKYEIPTFTSTICIEKGVIPHSHPILTLNTRVSDERNILETLIHEQFHWYAQEHPRYEKCISYLKTKYEDDGEHNKSGLYPNSYWEHIIVCYNTRIYLEKILPAEDVLWIYKQWQAYPTLEKLIEVEKEKIGKELKMYSIVF
jgi:hypothetical protein